VQKPHIPILIGGGGEKVTLKLVAQYGDACNVLGDLETIRHKLAVLKTHCETLGRDFATIHCTTGTVCSIAEDDETALALLPPPVRNQLRDTSLVGSPQTIRQRIAALQDVGIHELILDFPTSATDLTPIDRFAREFVAQ
jgi:alkanesulfonate monooxygenase SsuD/methylene tetrahydromethanopterin reductase-like flavin-dependent oxidoreductase (luciferase family)